MDWTKFSGKDLPIDSVKTGRAVVNSAGQCDVGPVDGSDPFGPDSLLSKVWFASPIFTSDSIARLETLCLTTFACNQGGCEDPEAGNYSWFELAILDSPSSSLPRLVDNRLLVWRSHDNNIDKKEKEERSGTTFGKNHEIWRFLKEGNVIAVRVCARFAGWANYAESGHLDIVVAGTPIKRINIQHDLDPQPQNAGQGRGGPGLRLLSLDGGGVRGIASLHILERLMFYIAGDENAKPCKYFDMIAGTSTGGLIAIMLGRLGLTVPECIRAYKKLSEQIFDDFKLNKAKNALGTGARYSRKKFVAAVEEFLSNVPGFKKDSPMLDPDVDACKVFVLACDASNTQNQLPVYVRTYTNPNASNPISATIVQAARATSAAPTYFTHEKIGDKAYIDGGLAANNPTQFLMLEAQSYFGVERPYASVVSLGTGQQPNVQIKGGIMGTLSLAVPGSWVSMVTGTEITHLLAKEDPRVKGCYYRYNPGKLDAAAKDWTAPIDLADWRNMHTMVTWTLDYLKDHLVDQDMKTCADKIKAVNPLHACSPAPISLKETKSENAVPSNVKYAVMAQGKLWINEEKKAIIIKYGFHPSAPEDMKTAVSTTIKTWEKYANVEFFNVGEDWTKAEIRISFDKNKGSWSTIGTDANDEQFSGIATMNLGRLPDNVADLTSRNKGTILHEFGHALGMMHEHQSPARGGAITLNEHELYRYYRPLLQNRDDLVKSQVIDVYNLSEVSNYSHFDEKSIMMYSMPGHLNQQKKDILPNDELSDLDKAFIMLNYPGRADNDDMTLNKALKTAGVLSSEVADDIKKFVASGNYPEARKRFIDYNQLVMDSVQVNATVVRTTSELSKQFALSPQEVNEKFENILNSDHFESVVDILVKQVFLQRDVAATNPAASILPKVSEDYISDVVNALIVHPAVVGVVNMVMDGYLSRS